MEFCYTFSWGNTVDFINSQFFSSMTGALAGAFAGAIAAHSISTKARRREEVEGQIRAVNAAIMSAFMVCNSMLSWKGQQIAKMHRSFLDERARYEASFEVPGCAAPDHFEMDLEFMSLPHVPMEVLSKQAYEKLNLRGRPLGLVSATSNALSMLQTRVELRNSLIGQFRMVFPSMSEKEKLDHYFGFPLADGSVHKEYADCINGINEYANDVIFFSSLLCEDLGKYGNDLRRAYVNKYRRDIEEISVMHFDTPVAKNLMPDPKIYCDWLTMFGSLPTSPKKPWYRRIL